MYLRKASRFTVFPFLREIFRFNEIPFYRISVLT